MADTKQTNVDVASKKELKTAKGTAFWNVQTELGARFTIWDKSIADAMSEGETYAVKYSEKDSPDGKFKNRTIEAIELDGKWVEQAKKSGFGGRSGYGMSAEQIDGMKTANCLNAAVALVGSPLFTARIEPTASVTDIAEVVTFFVGYFKQKVYTPAAAATPTPVATNGAAKAKKAAPIEEEMEVEEVA